MPGSVSPSVRAQGLRCTADVAVPNPVLRQLPRPDMALLHTLPGPMNRDVDRQVQDADYAIATNGLPATADERPFVPCVRRMVTVGMPTADVDRMEALAIGVLVVWVLVALGFAVLLGRGIRLADTRSAAERPLTTADLPAGFTPASSTSRR